jgi:hypothetical protein
MLFGNNVKLNNKEVSLKRYLIIPQGSLKGDKILL